jgi:hypothetical protein
VTNPIHPELTRLLEEYNQILNSYEANNITLDEATASLSRLSVTDGLGWVWAVDPQTGLFTKAAPDGTPQPADAADFAANQIPYAGAPSSPLLQPPNVGGAPPSLWTTPPGSDQYDSFTPPQPPPSRRGSGGSSTPPPRSNRSGSGGRGGFFSGNRRLVIIVGVIVVVVVIALLSRKSTTGTTTSSTLPPATSTSSTSPTTTTTVPVTSSTSPAQPGVPSVTQMNSVFGAISNGTQAVTDIRSSVVRPGTHVDIVQHVAFFTGLNQVGAYIIDGPARRVPGGATSTFTLRDGANGPRLYSGRATWVIQGGVWKLSTWPAFS